MTSDSSRPLDTAPLGVPVASGDLLPLVYEELRRLAAAKMARESGPRTLQPTALVHEVWLRLSSTPGGEWQNRAHFFGAAAEAMRRIMVERARRRSAAKRQPAIDLTAAPDPDESPDSILLIHESLECLKREDPQAAQVVLLKFFSGLSTGEIARMEGCSPRSVERRWTFAKARLYQIIRGASGPPPAQ